MKSHLTIKNFFQLKSRKLASLVDDENDDKYTTIYDVYLFVIVILLIACVLPPIQHHTRFCARYMIVGIDKFLVVGGRSTATVPM